MSAELKYLESATEAASAKLCSLYGYPQNTFCANVNYVEELPREVTDIPTIKRRSNDAQLILSVASARVWSNAVGDGCDEVGIDPIQMYASSGIALLELARVLRYSTDNNDPVARLRRIDKAFRKDATSHRTGAILSERTGVNFNNLIAGLDQDDSSIISKIRYGIGVSLKAFGIDKDGIERFAQTNMNEAVQSIENYKSGVVRFLSDAIFLEEIDPVDISSAELTQKVNNREFPYLRIAACVPMNVEYLLNK